MDRKNAFIRKRGILFTLGGGILWGFSGSCGQYIFTHSDMPPAWVTAVRMLTAGVLLVCTNLMRNRSRAVEIWKNRRDSVELVIFAIFGLLFCQFAYLTAISYSNAGTATVLQYLGPVMIMLLVCLKRRRLPDFKEGAAVVLAVAGTFLLATHGNLRVMVLTPKGLTWGLISAVSLVCYTMLPERIISKWGSMIVTGYAMLIGGALLAIVIRIWQIPITLDGKGWFAVAMIAIVGTLIAYTMYLQGVADIGPVKASMLSSVEPVSATVISVFWLGSPFKLMDLAGFVCIMSTVFLLTKKE